MRQAAMDSPCLIDRVFLGTDNNAQQLRQASVLALQIVQARRANMIAENFLSQSIGINIANATFVVTST